MAAPTGIADTLLGGTMGNVIRQLDRIKDEVGDIFPLQLPRTVVIGEESSGKSSVLERIAMIPIFPRGGDICTRMPIHLSLEHRSANEMQSRCQQSGAEYHSGIVLCHISFVNPQTGQKDETEYMRPEQIEVSLADNMRALVGDRGGLCQDPVTVHITGECVPDLRLVDLPGIQSAHIAGESSQMPAMTLRMAREHLAAPHTLGLIVVPASDTRVRNSRAFGLVQELRKEASCIGVLTMSDMVHERRRQEFILDRVQGTATDTPELGHGYVAVMNRDNGTQEHAQDIHAAAQQEMEWFRSVFPGVCEAGLAGSNAVVFRLSSMLADHVRDTWIPDTLRRLPSEVAKLTAELAAMGSDLGSTEPAALASDVLRRVAALISALDFRRGTTEDIAKLLRVYQRPEDRNAVAERVARATELERRDSDVSHMVRAALDSMVPQILDAISADGNRQPVAGGRGRAARGGLLLHRFENVPEFVESMVRSNWFDPLTACFQRLHRSARAQCDVEMRSKWGQAIEVWCYEVEDCTVVRTAAVLKTPATVVSTLSPDQLRWLCTEKEEIAAKRASLRSAIGHLEVAEGLVRELQSGLERSRAARPAVGRAQGSEMRYAAPE